MRRPVRILRVITRLNVGGPSYQAIFLTERLQGPAFESHLVAGSVGANEGSMESLAEKRQVSVTRIPELGREISLGADLSSIRSLCRVIRHFRPDLIHTHLAKAGWAGRLAAILCRVPRRVHTYHGHVFHGYFSARKTRVILAMERWLARHTDRLIVLSKQQRDEILGYGVGRPDQMSTIPLGLELGPFLRCAPQRGQLRAELGVGPDTKLVGIVARLVPIKDHALFLESVRVIRRRLPDAMFLVVGDGELRPELEKAAADLGSSIRFLGFRSDLPAIYADLDVAVLSSRNEGLPVTLIEALAAGCPVAATDVGAVRDLVIPGETGWLASDRTPEGLARAMFEALTSTDRDRISGAGVRHVDPRFSIERLEVDLRRLYDDLVGN